MFLERISLCTWRELLTGVLDSDTLNEVGIAKYADKNRSRTFQDPENCIACCEAFFLCQEASKG